MAKTPTKSTPTTKSAKTTTTKPKTATSKPKAKAKAPPPVVEHVEPVVPVEPMKAPEPVVVPETRIPMSARMDEPYEVPSSKQGWGKWYDSAWTVLLGILIAMACILAGKALIDG